MAKSAAATPVIRLTGVKNWAMALKDPKAAEITACAADVVIMDSTTDGTKSGTFTKDAVSRMRGNGTKKLIAYISIGEAEDFRDHYWKDSWNTAPPSFLTKLGSGWQGDYFVRYWEPAWQQIIEAYLDLVIERGFDGVFLDKVDSWEKAEEVLAEANANPGNAKYDMIAFVARLAKRATDKKKDFLVIANNGDALLDFADMASSVSAVVTEDVFFCDVSPFDCGGKSSNPKDHDVEPRAPQGVRDRLKQRDLARRLGVPLLGIEYLRDKPEDSKIAPHVGRYMRDLGYIPQFSDRDSNRLACDLSF